MHVLFARSVQLECFTNIDTLVPCSTPPRSAACAMNSQPCSQLRLDRALKHHSPLASDVRDGILSTLNWALVILLGSLPWKKLCLTVDSEFSRAVPLTNHLLLSYDDESPIAAKAFLWSQIESSTISQCPWSPQSDIQILSCSPSHSKRTQRTSSCSTLP